MMVACTRRPLRLGWRNGANGGLAPVERFRSRDNLDREAVAALVPRLHPGDLPAFHQVGATPEPVRDGLDAQCIGALGKALPLLQPRQLLLAPADLQTHSEAAVE